MSLLVAYTVASVDLRCHSFTAGTFSPHIYIYLCYVKTPYRIGLMHVLACLLNSTIILEYTRFTIMGILITCPFCFKSCQMHYMRMLNKIIFASTTSLTILLKKKREKGACYTTILLGEKFISLKPFPVVQRWY